MNVYIARARLRAAMHDAIRKMAGKHSKPSIWKNSSCLVWIPITTAFEQISVSTFIFLACEIQPLPRSWVSKARVEASFGMVRRCPKPYILDKEKFETCTPTDVL